MINVHVPGTSANLCIGYDCLGMAVNIYNHFSFEKSDALKITGCPEEFQNEDNLVIVAFKRVCSYLNKEFPSFHLHIDSDIPVSSGLGSSASCLVAGIVGANAWFDAKLEKSVLVALATELEGHPDNVAPAILGQACVSVVKNEQAYSTMIPCANWYGLAIMTDYQINTKKARRVLPASISHKEAAMQVANALIFVQALQSGDEKMMVEVCQDFLHEPYRRPLIKEFDAIHSYCFDRNFPMWISGSGPTMMAISTNQDNIKGLKSWIEERYTYIDCKEVTIDQKGAYIEYE